ncbi:MAG: DUF547 domain-containing protein [Bacteroidota bacterium]
MSTAQAQSLLAQAAAQELLRATKTGDRTQISTSRQRLQALTVDELESELNTQNKRLAFWVNCYNAFAQLIIEDARTADGKVNTSVFSKKRIAIGGHAMSLDDIEHGILRKSQWKLGLGYIRKWFPGKFERRLRVFELDPRIHFALNCGATSCPVIGFYEAESIDESLDLATRQYLEQTVDFDTEQNVVHVPKVFSWFRGDFGGKSGTRELLLQYELIPEDTKPRIKYKDWDWTLRLGNFSKVETDN